MARTPSTPHPEPIPPLDGEIIGARNETGGGVESLEGVGGSCPPPLQRKTSPLSAKARGGGSIAEWRRGGKGGEAQQSPAHFSRAAQLFAVVILAASALIVAPAAAQEPTPSDDEVNAIARGLYCPVCENVPLDVCPTQACEQWRATIREKLTLGWSEQQIKDYFVAQYGDRVLAAPPARGFNWLVYLLPPLALLGAGFLLWQTMRRWQRAGAQTPPPPVPSETDPYVQQLEEELKRRG